MAIKRNSGRVLILFLLAILISGATVGCGALDDIIKAGAPAADELDDVIRLLSSTIDDLARGLRASGDEITAAQRQAIRGKLVGISCGVALNLAKGEDQPADVIESQVYSTLTAEVGEALAGQTFGDSVSIVYTLVQEINNQSGGDPFQIDRICAGISN